MAVDDVERVVLVGQLERVGKLERHLVRNALSLCLVPRALEDHLARTRVFDADYSCDALRQRASDGPWSAANVEERVGWSEVGEEVRRRIVGVAGAVGSQDGLVVARRVEWLVVGGHRSVKCGWSRGKRGRRRVEEKEVVDTRRSARL